MDHDWVYKLQQQIPTSFKWILKYWLKVSIKSQNYFTQTHHDMQL